MACDVLKTFMFLLLFNCLTLSFYFVICEDYKIMLVEASDTCPYANRKKNIHRLSQDEKSGLILVHVDYFKDWKSKDPFECNFIVQANKQGLFAVIQDMYLRKNPVTNHCIDYIQFKRPKSFLENFNFKKDHDKGTKFCGQMKATEINTSDPNNLLAPNAYIDENGEIEVDIYIAPVKTLDNETLNFEIVFTPFRYCKYDSNNYKSCGSNKCIWYNYFNDNKVNCPYVDCKDAGSCISNLNGTRISKGRDGLGTRATMSAIASVFSVFLVFISCLWLCRHCGVFCFDTSHPTIHLSPVEMSDVHVTPSAPPLADDKDLPPSYDSLFPEER